MRRRPAAPPQRAYEDFEPECKLHNEEGGDVIELDVHGFEKRQLRVQVSSTGDVTVSGERPLDDQRWIKFRKVFKFPKEYKLDGTRAKLAGNVLHVIVPVPKEMRPQAADVAQETPQTGGGLERRGSGKPPPPASMMPPPPPPPPLPLPPVGVLPTVGVDEGMLWLRASSWSVGINKKRALLALAVVAVLAGIGVGGFLIWRRYLIS
ncbi:hypothetical protein ACJRO7_002129 [Eucalyptus globulus]|uniref:SHSP domain-containing protein n=1 Tax=Eucalyptus globulus TaxID=34317 RepID=A0ABD3LYV1_EUCGL